MDAMRKMAADSDFADEEAIANLLVDDIVKQKAKQEAKDIARWADSTGLVHDEVARGKSGRELTDEEFLKLRRIWGLPKKYDETALKRRKKVKYGLGALVTGLNAGTGAMIGGALTREGSGAAAGAGIGALGSLLALYFARRKENKKARAEIALGKRHPVHRRI